jgi:hypothetical protein
MKQVRDLRSSWISRPLDWQVFTDVSEQPIGPIFKVKKSSVPTFRDNLSFTSSRVKKSEKKAFFLNFLILEDGTDRLSRNVGTALPLNAA